MSLGIRWIQRRNYMGLQLLEGPEGLSEFDFTLGPSTITGAATWALSTDTSGIAPANPVGASIVTQGITDTGTTTPDFTLDIASGQSIGSGWVTVLWLQSNQAAGAVAFDLPMTITKAEDASGAAISVLVGPDLTYLHTPPSAVQAAEAALLDNHLGPMGVSDGDSIGRRHFSEYQPAAPVGPFGLPDSPIINANLNDEELSALLRVGFLVRGRGANAFKVFLTEAGKRSAGFSL